ncbi:hypothetical protein WA158_007663 [Blastocystis sp. Blastoise]
MSSLDLFNELPSYDELNILVLGTATLIKSTPFIKFLADFDTEYLHKIRVSTSYPLPENPNRPRIEYIVILVSMDNQMSFEFFKNTIQQLSDSYLNQRICVVVFNSKQTSSFTFPISDLREIVQPLYLHVFYCESINIQSQKIATEAIFTLAERCWKKQKNINSLFNKMTF